MFCPKCGAEILEGAEFCQKCGAKLINSDTAPQGAEASGRQEPVAAGNTQVPPPNAVKGKNLQKLAMFGKVLLGIAMVLLILRAFIGLSIISPPILAVAAALGIILSAIGMKKPLKVSKIIELVCAGIVLVVVVAVLIGTGGENDKYIKMVKEGTLEAYPSKTVGEAFDGYLKNPKWESGVSEDGTRCVNVTGKILYYEKETDILVQFIIENDKTGSFSYNACELNGVPQNNFFVLGLLEVIYNGDESPSPDSSSDYVPGANSIRIGETRSVSVYDGEMEVTLDSIEFTDGPLLTQLITMEYDYHIPDDGFTYLVATLTVKNTGTTNTSLFTGGSTVIYDGKYEYKSEYWTMGESISELVPLSDAKTTAIVFMVPKAVADSEDALVINISGAGEYGSEDISYVIRQSDSVPSGLDVNGSGSGIEDYEGSWHGLEYVNDRMFMEISYVDANGGYFDISISWSSSASEWTQWELQGVYTEEGVMQYYGNEIEYEGSYETGETEENVVSEAEEGVLWIGDDGLLYWDDYTEPSGETYAFEKSVY